MTARAIPGIVRAVRLIARVVNMLRALHCLCPCGPVLLHTFETFQTVFLHVSWVGWATENLFLKSKGFLRNAGHWKKHGFETFSGFEKIEKRDNIAR